MIACTLVAGGSAGQRQAAIAVRLDTTTPTAIILEGLHPAHPAFDVPTRATSLSVVTIAPDCPCCGAGLVLRVTLDRMVHRHPRQLFISLADAGHLPHLGEWLSAPPYAKYLSLTPAIVL